jgi:hypothetical protein
VPPKVGRSPSPEPEYCRNTIPDAALNVSRHPSFVTGACIAELLDSLLKVGRRTSPGLGVRLNTIPDAALKVSRHPSFVTGACIAELLESSLKVGRRSATTQK